MTKIIVLNSHPIQYFAPLYKHFANNGFDIEVWYCSDESVKGHLDKGFGTSLKWDIPLLEGYKYRIFKNHSWKPSIHNGFFGLINLGILKALFNTPKSILWVHGWSNFICIAAIITAKICGHKVYLRAESPLNQELLKSKLNRFLKRIFLQYILFKLTDKFLYIGNQNKAFYKYYGVKEYNLFFVPYSVDNLRFQAKAKELLPQKIELRKELSIPSNSKVILYSGKYILKKRPLDLLKAFKLLVKNQELETKSQELENYSEFALVMVGDGELRPEMEQYITKNLLKNVFLTGFINQSEITKYYAIANVFVMCSEQGETWGLSVNEAMNFGLPVVVSDLTGCSTNLVDSGKNGYIHKTGDIDDLTDKIQKALFLSTNNSKSIIDYYSYNTIVNNFE